MKSEHLDALNRTAAANRIGEGTVQLIALAVRQHEDECHAPKAASIPQPQADAGDVPESFHSLANEWRKKATASYEEADRIRKAIKGGTNAEDRCLARAGVWEACANKLDARAAIAAGVVPTDPELVERAAEAAYDRYRKGCKIKLPAWSECNDKDRWRGIARAAIAAVTYQTGGAK